MGKIIDCETCQDTGIVQVVKNKLIIVCCGHPLANGECCSNGINDYEDYIDIEPCENCIEKNFNESEKL